MKQQRLGDDPRVDHANRKVAISESESGEDESDSDEELEEPEEWVENRTHAWIHVMGAHTHERLRARAPRNQVIARDSSDLQLPRTHPCARACPRDARCQGAFSLLRLCAERLCVLSFPCVWSLIVRWDGHLARLCADAEEDPVAAGAGARLVPQGFNCPLRALAR